MFTHCRNSRQDVQGISICKQNWYTNWVHRHCVPIHESDSKCGWGKPPVRILSYEIPLLKSIRVHTCRDMVAHFLLAQNHLAITERRHVKVENKRTHLNRLNVLAHGCVRPDLVSLHELEQLFHRKQLRRCRLVLRHDNVSWIETLALLHDGDRLRIPCRVRVHLDKPMAQRK